jgi:hypothetical protein
MFARVRALISAFGRSTTGNVVVLFGLSVPVLAMGVGGAVDYARYTAAVSGIRSIADGAALAGAQAMRLSNATSRSVSATASAYVGGHTTTGMATIAVATNVVGATVAVQLDQNVPTVMGRFAGVSKMHVSASAKARLAGGSLPNCMIALDPTASAATLVDQATVTATGCQIFSDASPADGLSISDGARISAGIVCSHGGAKNDGTASITPPAQTDCPTLVDPLASRAQPTVGSCNFNGLKIAHGSHTLSPGVYCGGLQISGNANVNLLAGTYVIKGGQLLLKAGGSLSGTDVTIFLTGSGATLNVENHSSVSLTAPSTGANAGMLVIEDRASPLGQTHSFASRNAPNMLGTIYLPQGYLNIGTKGAGGGSGVAVGASSAWTVIVARQIAIADQQAVMLNTNYAATTVPPPAGVAPVASEPQLIQ